MSAKKSEYEKQLDIYLPEGWVDIPYIIELAIKSGCYFIFITGGRGTGKTFGTYEYLLLNGIRFVLIRRTIDECKMLADNPEMNPMFKNSKKLGINLYTEKAFKDKIVYYKKEEDNSTCAMQLPLSSIANMRGIDGDSFDVLFYDEFIPEQHVRVLRNEADAYMNAYETINRNRELEDPPRRPVISICAANANTMDNEMFVGLNLVTNVYNMRKENKRVSFLRDRGIMLVDLPDSEISQKKATTALYKMAKGTSYYGMAIDNQFYDQGDYINVKPMNIKGFTAIASVGELCIYEKKDGTYYVCSHKSGNPLEYQTSDVELMRFKKHFQDVLMAYLDYNVYFEKPVHEVLLRRYFNL